MQGPSETPHYPPMILDPEDRIRIEDVDFRPESRDEYGHVLVPVDGRLPPQGFSHEELWRLSRTARFRHDRKWFSAGKIRARMRADVVCLADLPKGETPKVLWKHEFCRRFLVREQDGTASRSDDSMRGAIDQIHAEMISMDIAKVGHARAGDEIVVRKRPGVKTLRTWLTALEGGDFEIYALRDGYRNCGRVRGSRIELDLYNLLVRHAALYAREERPTKAHCYAAFLADVAKLNEKRAAAALPRLRPPCDKTLFKEIDALDRFEVYAKRHGLGKARSKFRLVTRSLDVVRPGERVEMDEWSIPLMQLLRAVGIWELLPTDLRTEVETARRWWLSAAVDVASRCFLALRLSPNPNGATNGAALRMVCSDKRRYADAVGALSPWDQCCTPETVATDGGAGYVNDGFRRRLADLGSTHLVPPGGNPHLRPFVERAFGTMRTSFSSRFKGQTFTDVVARGDYPAEDRANVTAEEIAAALVRYAVDDYHNRPHAGLGGETPRNAWIRLTGMFGIIPPPSPEKARHVFGEDIVRTVSTRGVRVLGLYYRSRALGELFLSRGSVEVDVRIDPDDLGRVSVMIGDAWHGIGCDTPGLDGISVSGWLASVADLRRRFADASRITLPIVHESIRALGRIAEEAELRAGIAAPLVTSEHVDRAERELVRGFEVPDEEAAVVLPSPSADPRHGAIPVGGAGAAEPAGTLEGVGRKKAPSRKRRRPLPGGTSPASERPNDVEEDPSPWMED